MFENVEQGTGPFMRLAKTIKGELANSLQESALKMYINRQRHFPAVTYGNRTMTKIQRNYT